MRLNKGIVKKQIAKIYQIIMLEHDRLLRSEIMKGQFIFDHQLLHTGMMIHSDCNSTVNLSRNICHNRRIKNNNNIRCLMQIMVKVGAISALTTVKAESTMLDIFITVINGKCIVKIGAKHTIT
jgi:hypothetical protein